MPAFAHDLRLGALKTAYADGSLTPRQLILALRDQAAAQPDTDWYFEYSPETFSTAELDFSLEVCEAVMDVLRPTPDHKLILNLPATVECATPNVYADQIEWFGRNIRNRDCVDGT